MLLNCGRDGTRTVIDSSWISERPIASKVETFWPVSRVSTSKEVFSLSVELSAWATTSLGLLSYVKICYPFHCLPLEICPTFDMISYTHGPRHELGAQHCILQCHRDACFNFVRAIWAWIESIFSLIVAESLSTSIWLVECQSTRKVSILTADALKYWLSC